MQEKQKPKLVKFGTSSTKNMHQKTIAVSQQTYLRLVQLGKMKESFDKLLSRLIDEIGDRRRIAAESGSGIESP
jgi:hypothetical protein